MGRFFFIVVNRVEGYMWRLKFCFFEEVEEFEGCDV